VGETKKKKKRNAQLGVWGWERFEKGKKLPANPKNEQWQEIKLGHIAGDKKELLGAEKKKIEVRTNTGAGAQGRED